MFYACFCNRGKCEECTDVIWISLSFSWWEVTQGYTRVALEILLFLLFSEDGTEIFQVWDKWCFYFPYISVVLLSSAEVKGMQVRKELGALTNLTMAFQSFS